MGLPVYSAFWVSVTITVLILIADLIIAQNRIEAFRIFEYAKIVFLHILFVSAITVFILYLIHSLFRTNPWISLIIDISLTILMLYSIGLSGNEKNQLREKIRISLNKLYGNHF